MANQQNYLQHDGFVNNETDLPQYDYSSTQDPSSGTVFSHYDLPQSATTGFANQPYHFVTQDQPNYFVADPTMASSLRMASREDYLQHNGFLNNVTDLPHHHCSNAQPSSCTVLSHYDLPQTATTGFANQPHHFVTQDQPNYFVADSTMDSSLLSPANEGDHDIMIDLDDLWNDMVQPAAVF
ncbi:hypothetical protein ACFX2C_028300 [Malus domestica]